LNFHILLCDVLQHHVDVDVKPAEGAHELLVPLHDHPDLGPDAAVDQLCSPAPQEQAQTNNRFRNADSRYNTAMISE
jgi:hypothetical protein